RAEPAACPARPRPDDGDAAVPPSVPRPQHPNIVGIALRPAAKYGSAGNQHIGTGIDRPAGGLAVDAAVDLEIDRPSGLIDHLAHRLDLAQLRFDEGLTAEARIDA